MATNRDISDEIEKAREHEDQCFENMVLFEKKLIDATRFLKSFETYLKEHAPEVFDEDGEINRLKLGDYCEELRREQTRS